MKTAIIIDDEKKAIEVLAWQLKQFCPEIEVAGWTTNVPEAIVLIKNKQPDIIFLDIEMPMQNGFDLLETFEDPAFDIIFTTAYNQYAIKAIKFAAFDYLLKPIESKDLKASIDRYLLKKGNSIKDQLKELANRLQQNQLNRIAVPSLDGLMMLKPEQIVRCESENNYTKVFLDSKQKIVVAKTLKEIEDTLSGFQFYRIHQSHLVNLMHIQSFIRNDGGYVVMTDGTQLTVARNRKNGLIDHFSKL